MTRSPLKTAMMLTAMGALAAEANPIYAPRERVPVIPNDKMNLAPAELALMERLSGKDKKIYISALKSVYKNEVRPFTVQDFQVVDRFIKKYFFAEIDSSVTYLDAEIETFENYIRSNYSSVQWYAETYTTDTQIMDYKVLDKSNQLDNKFVSLYIHGVLFKRWSL